MGTRTLGEDVEASHTVGGAGQDGLGGAGEDGLYMYVVHTYIHTYIHDIILKYLLQGVTGAGPLS
jgi:hypothetical protein